jgi:hypothetical protein
MYRVCAPRREIGDISASAALQWEARSHPIVASGDAAPQPMKMGTIASPWRYDATADQAPPLANLRRPSNLRCTRSAAAFDGGAVQC